MKSFLRLLFIASFAALSFTSKAQIAGCTPPTLLGVSTDSTKATIMWVYNALSTVPVTFTVEYTAAPVTNSSTWVSATATGATAPGSAITYVVNGLTTCKEYAFRVKTNCSPTLSSSWSQTIFAKTKGCAVVIPCTAPAFVSVSTDTTKAFLAWTGSSAAGTTYVVEYTAAPQTNNSTWTAVNSNTNSTTITGLNACTGYLFRVKAVCSATSSSSWSAIRDAKTKGCVVVLPCLAPTITSINSDSTKVNLAWAANTTGAPGSYVVEYTTAPVTNASTWTAVNSNTTSATITGLNTCTSYIFRVKTVCSATSSSSWSQYRDTKTKGCVVVVPCTAPVFTTVSTDTTKATLGWTANTTAGTTYTVEYTTAPANSASTWTAVSSNTNSVTITGLTACTGYIFRVKANCSPTSSSSWSQYRDAKTKGCVVVVPCTAPVFATVSMDTTKATLTWSSNNAAGTTFTVEYTTAPVSSNSTWTAVNSSTNTVTITGLTACTNYMFRVKANCSPTSSSSWSANRDGKTKGCVVVVPCSTPAFTTISTDTTTATLNWVSNNAAGTTFTVEYTAAPVSNSSTWTAVNSTTNSVTITGLTACTNYVFRVKAVCSATSSSSWSNYRDAKTKGCVVVTPCLPVTITNATSDSTSATITWATLGAVPTATSYTVEYTAAPATSTSTWISATVTGTTFTASGLLNCKEYIFRVKANCSATSFSAWSNTKGVQTKGCAPVCKTPNDLKSTVNGLSANLSWNGFAVYYQVRIRTLSNKMSNWEVIDSITANNLVRNNLTKCTRYVWQVRAKCANGTWTSWSNTNIFMTGNCTKSTSSSLLISPNPSNQLNLAYSLTQEGTVTFDVMDVQGRLVKTIDSGVQYSGDNYLNVEDIDVQSGIYFIIMKIDGIQQEAQRWIKE